MTLTTHATLGAVIGHATGNPILAFIIAFLVHFIADMIPHGDHHISDNFRVHHRKKKMAVAYTTIDAVCAIFFVLFLFNAKDILSIQNFTWGIIGAVLPDFIVGLHDLTKSKYVRWFNNLHFWFHGYFVKRFGDVPLKYSIIAQLILIGYLQSKL